MIITFDYKEGVGQIYILENFISFTDIHNGKLMMDLNMLKAKIRRASKFRSGGIPGKKITNEPEEEILKFLNSQKNTYEICNIEVERKNGDNFEIEVYR